MRYSKSSLIVLFVSFTLSTFYYALTRTNGDIFKSLQFTIYCLSLQFNLIGPNLGGRLDQDYSNQ